MEATNEAGLLYQRLFPPRLEDAGLEDCALPPDSIKEAFLKAATAIKSRATAIFDEDDDCVNDPWPELKDGGGDLGGVNPETRSPGPCCGSKGGAVEAGGDDVVVGGEEEKKDEVIVGGGDVRNGGDRGCVDGLAGLGIGEKEEEEEITDEIGGGDVEDEEEKGGEGPILVGGYV